MTLEEFLTWKEKQEPRWEFDGVARGNDWGNVGAFGHRAEPDLFAVFFVLCSDVGAGGAGAQYFEHDYGVSHGERPKGRATVVERIDGDWVGHIMSGDPVLRMPEIAIEIPLNDLYLGVPLPNGEATPDACQGSEPTSSNVANDGSAGRFSIMVAGPHRPDRSMITRAERRQSVNHAIRQSDIVFRPYSQPESDIIPGQPKGRHLAQPSHRHAALV
jgi:hypothetical protein